MHPLGPAGVIQGQHARLGSASWLCLRVLGKKLSVCVKVSGGNAINRLIKRANDGGGGDRKGGGGLGGAELLVKTGGGGVRDSSDKTGGGTSVHYGVTRRGDQGGPPPLLLLMLLPLLPPPPPPQYSRGRARTCPPSLTTPLKQNEVLAEGAAGERGHVTSVSRQTSVLLAAR